MRIFYLQINYKKLRICDLRNGTPKKCTDLCNSGENLKICGSVIFRFKKSLHAHLFNTNSFSGGKFRWVCGGGEERGGFSPESLVAAQGWELAGWHPQLAGRIACDARRGGVGGGGV